MFNIFRRAMWVVVIPKEHGVTIRGPFYNQERAQQYASEMSPVSFPNPAIIAVEVREP